MRPHRYMCAAGLRSTTAITKLPSSKQDDLSTRIRDITSQIASCGPYTLDLQCLIPVPSLVSFAPCSIILQPVRYTRKPSDTLILKLGCGRLKGFSHPLVVGFHNIGFYRRVELMLIIIREMVIRSIQLLKKRCGRPGAPSLRLSVVFSYSLYLKKLSLYIPPANTPGSCFLPDFMLRNGQLGRIETSGLCLRSEGITSRQFNFLAISRFQCPDVRLHSYRQL